MALRDPPTSETDLLQRRPSSFRAESFPRHWLQADERILFETRPGILRLYWGRLTIAVIWGLLWVGTAFAPTTTGGLGFDLAALILGGPPIVLIVLAWRGYAYALTNVRVLATSGIVSRSLEFARYDEVQGLTVGSGVTDDITFQLGAQGVAPAGRRAAGRPLKVVWTSVPMAQQVYQFVQDAFRLEGARELERRSRTAFVARALRTRVVCAYCHNLVDFDPDQKSGTKCPSCGAPIRLDPS
ncbi:MAG: hypothetical protein ACHQ16_01600 [Candidatus Lutacidiplasmatales archaeon]